MKGIGVNKLVMGVAVLSILALGGGSKALCKGAPGSRDVDLDAVAAKVSTDEVLAQIRKKYKRSSKKYKALAKKIEVRVERVLAETPWHAARGDGRERHLSEHPHLLLVASLKQDVMSRSKSTLAADERDLLLKRYPWPSDLELVLGLQYGTDRAVPRHKQGFIDLGELKCPLPGFPELKINRYLYGFQEIAGWQYLVKHKKTPSYMGRTKVSQDSPFVAELPPWESIRLHLDGVLPDAALFAVPGMIHRIHGSLVEARRGGSGELSGLDEFLAFMESRWNGFMFQNPYTGRSEAFVQPIHAVFMEKGSFVYAFPLSLKLAQQGDIPFVSIQVYQEYAKRFLEKEITVRDFIIDTAGANAARSRFIQDSEYLARYKSLIELIARAILTPGIAFPRYLSSYDYGGGLVPSRKDAAVKQDLDMPRKHAILAWVHAGKDIGAVAAYIQKEVLSQAQNRFPGNASLPVQFTLSVRKNEAKMIPAIISRIEKERAGEPALTGEGYAPGDFESEFSPYVQIGSLSGSYSSDMVAASFHEFNEPIAQAVRRAALEVVIKEIGDRWIK